jgi:hypothetical protein
VWAPLRVVALVMVVGLFGFAGWMLGLAWTHASDAWAGLVDLDPQLIVLLLVPLPFLMIIARRLWLVARSGEDLGPEDEVIAAV